MSQEADIDVKNIYVIGENLKARLGSDLEREFSGQKLVSWLLAKDGQVSSREEGVKLGQHLIEYRVIQHVQEKYHFQDDPSRMYSFCSDNHGVYPRTDSQRQIWVQGLSIMRQLTADMAGTKKRRTSWINFSKSSQHSVTYKGKHLIEWLEKNTDFENREDCRRFLKSLIKLNFLRRSQENDLRFDPAGDYWFYLSRLKEDPSKIRKISKTILSEGRRQSTQETTSTSTRVLTRKQSVIGLTPDLMSQLHTFQAKTGQSSGNGQRPEPIKLKDTCVVLRSSLSRTSLNTSKNSLTGLTTSTSRNSLTGLAASQSSLNQSHTSLNQSRTSLKQSYSSLAHRCHSSSGLSSNLTHSTTSLPCVGTAVEQTQRSSYCDNGDSSYVLRLKEQYSQPRPRSTLSESKTEAAISDLIESEDFQKRLQNIGKSSSQRNLKQVEVDKQAILNQLSQRKYGPARRSREDHVTRLRNHVIISPSSSCPNNLDSYLKRDYSTESRATKSSGYGSIRGKCHSITFSSRDNSFDDVITSSSSSSLDSADGCHGYESIASSRDSFSCQTPTSQNNRVGEDHTVLVSDDVTTTEPRDRSRDTPRDGPIPPPRRSLEREPLMTESDSEMSTPTNRLMSVSGAMMQTATSARRARLTRARAVSDGDSKSA